MLTGEACSAFLPVMSLAPTRFPLLLVLVAACGGGGTPPAPDDVDARPTDAATIDAGGDGLATATARAADAVCGALYRCCDDDLVEYFAPYVADDRLAAFRNRLPPQATLDEAGCRVVMSEMLDQLYLGAWVDAATAGEVAFDDGGFAQCVAALDQAACGAPARAALWDSTCFGLAPPGGGDQQRAFVHRTRSAGASCTPVRDGLGGVFYGTCDPAVAFCCYSDPAHPGCQFPFDSGGAARPGQCQAVAGVGASCSASAPLALCATGVNCDAESNTCVDPPDGPLAVGVTCVDSSYNLLGTCVDSWCDVLGTHRCEALKADGVACTGGDECLSGACRTTCQPDVVCTGDGDPVDAGVDAPIDAAVDAGVDAAIDASVDAPVDAPPADGERCATADDLRAASSASPLNGYTHRIQASLGTANDYNPYRSAATVLPPNCAFVYDARGRDRVYAVTLQPGDRLSLRAELSGGRQAGVYLLDTCPGGSWPDFDGTGACGNNEYGVGFCGPVGCDAAALVVTYPAMIGGNPSPPATFWVVVDQVNNDDAASFTLDWRITPI